ncbi:hypothetical protein [Microlunatus soli]|uniref:Uncharacterized protein n=1 Tax=Microlunatus soli TaxID=630515 RepID=A0A1H1N5A5_9ACTN|nr:hypothetical protein [Microlunatus soli]SDR94331.1 hypothetical protein SAMN04489812_0394 [Microlunatus soli]
MTSGPEFALGRVHHGEHRLLALFTTIRRQHPDEHEVYHVCGDLARWSTRHLQLINEQARRLGIEVADDSPDTEQLLDDSDEPGLRLLNDLVAVHLQAADNSVSWELLGQLAQATRRSELLGLTESCHPQNLRQLRWANSMIKILSPQILSSL